MTVSIGWLKLYHLQKINAFLHRLRNPIMSFLIYFDWLESKIIKAQTNFIKLFKPNEALFKCFVSECVS